MSTAPRPSADVVPMPRSISVADALALRVPLFYVVEADPFWAEEYLEARLLAAQRDSGAVAGRWSRTAGWDEVGHATSMFSLAGTTLPPETSLFSEQGDPAVRLLELRAYLEPNYGTAPGEPHPMDGALLWVRGLEPELDRPALREILQSLARVLRTRGASLMIEMSAEPAAPARVLGPVIRDRAPAAVRYGGYARRILAAEGAPLTGMEPIARAFEGLTSAEADLVMRVVLADARLAGRPGLDAALRVREVRQRYGLEGRG